MAENNKLQPYITQSDFVTSCVHRDGNPDYKSFLSEILHHQIYISAKRIKVRFDFRAAVPAATNLIGYDLLLTNKLVSVSSDGQRQFDLT